MKQIKFLFFFIALAIFGACNDDDSTTSVNAPSPTNVSAVVSMTQDNTGLTTITPLGENITSFEVDFGDGSDIATGIEPGSSVMHNYAEGSYQVTITGMGLDGETMSTTQTVVVSFIAPENLMVTIENDAAISKQVNVTVEADYAATYTVTFGDEANGTATANIGDAVSYQYAEPGIYTITVEVMGAASETTTYTQEFEVTAIEQPLASAATPPFRPADDVISFFTTAYENEAGTDFFPDWGQAGQGSSWNLFDLNGDEMLQYANLSYQGNQFAQAYDVSGMEYVHFDFWTAEALESVEVSLISLSNGERPVVVPLTPNEWTSVDIPLSEFTDQDGFTINDIHQIKYVGAPWAAGTVFVDNIYFWRTSTQQSAITGTWKMSPTAASLKVGPEPGSGAWWAIDEAGVAQRACFYDDEYVFSADGTFQNMLGADTWLEAWQGVDADICGAPVAPHNGQSATFTFDEDNGVVSLIGEGSYLGIPKANNQGELPNVDVPQSITYNVTFNDANNMTVTIEAGSGVFWTFEMIKTN